MRADQISWATGQAPAAGGARHAPAIEANLARLLTDYPDTPNAWAVLDVINYYVQPEWRTQDGVLQSQAQAVAWCERLMAQYPAAPESWPACRTLASLVQQQDPQRAFALIEAAIQQRPDAPEAPELQMQLADFRLGSQDYAAAAAAYEEIGERWPQSPLAPTALQNANRTRMQSDQAFWATDQGPGAGGARNAPAIEANLERLLADYPDSPNGAGTLLDAINYFAQPEWWTSGAGPQGRAKVVALAERMIALYPDTALTCAARAGLAQAITAQDPQRGEALLDSSLEWAIKNNDHEHYVGLWFAKGEFYASIGQPAKSRAALEEVLRSEPTEQVAGEARLCIAYTYAREGRLVDATRTFDELSQSATYTDDIRATAAYGKALELWAAGQDEAARQALAVVLSQFPDELSTADARECQERWNQPRVRFIGDPGTREAK
jgi:TolA-binding protein